MRPFRVLTAILLSAAVLPWHGAHAADDYPARPIKLIVGYAAGGPVDTSARRIAIAMQSVLGQSVVVDNRPGAGGAIGGEMLAKAPADGYTLMLAASPTQTTTPHLLSKMSYDPRRDYTPIAMLAAGPNILVVRKDSPANSVADLIAQAKANPGKMSFGSAGIGASNHLAGELLARVTGTPLLHVPYKGNSQAMTALLGGETSFQFAGVTDVASHIRSGTLKGLAVTASRRNAALPDIPTMAEAGVKDFDVSVWYAMEGPPGLPKAITDKLTAAMFKVMQDNQVADYFRNAGFDIVTAGPEEVRQRIDREYEVWGKLIPTLGIKPN
jgi:tripartite-type tricarboxylate transporter receptor subunit TctC